MAYRIKSGECFPDAVRRIALEQIGKAIDEAGDHDIGINETVHQVRKRCKKVRGLIRLFRPAFEDTYQKENASFRDVARRLSSQRDATSMLECFDGLMARYGSNIETEVLEAIREKLCAHYDRINQQVDPDERLEAFVDHLHAARKRVDGWSFDPGGFDAAAAGVKKTYKRGARAMTVAYEDSTERTFHQWRKRVKYHWYHMRLLRDLWEPVIAARAAALDRLSDLLGDDHDLAVLRRLLFDHPEHFGDPGDLHGLLTIIDARRGELQAWAHPLGLRLYAERPAAFAGRLRRYWDAWLEEQQLAAALPDRAARVCT